MAPAKFVVPRIPNATLFRPTLLSRLDAGDDAALTLVSAGPGSGKSALLADWVATVPNARWLTCEPEHGDADQFWADLAHAIDPGGMEILDEGDPRDQVLALVDMLDAGKPTAIVVDDFHNAHPAPDDVMALVAALPASVRLVLSTRVDPPLPLGRLRVQGRLLELRQSDLRFTPGETAALLGGYGVSMSPDELVQLDDLTDGWTAGVQLAGLSLQANPRPVELLKSLSETNRSLVDFLMNEVIDLQSPDMRDFLMATAELETFDAALADAVRGATDSAAMIERVRAANLFLIQIDPDEGWFRYHHLFGRFLQARLRATQPEPRTEMHRRAAAACSERGLLGEAIRHHAKASDMEAARALIVRYASESLSIDDRNLAREVARAWLQEFGADALDRAPSALLECVFVLASATTSAEPDHWLRRVDDRLEALDSESRFLDHAVWAFHLLRCGDPAASLAHARLAAQVAERGEVDSVWARANPVVSIQALILLDDTDGARAELQMARRAAEGMAPMTEVRLPGLASLVAARAGDLIEADRLAEQALAGADRLGLDTRNYGRAAPLLALAIISLERGDLDQAEAKLESALRIAEDGARPPIELLAQLAFARLLAARGEHAAAHARIARARAVMPDPQAPILGLIDRAEARLLARPDAQVVRGARDDGLVDPLSDRELTVLRCLAGAQDSREIADSLYLSVNTVRTHVKAIYRKLGVGSRADAVSRARDLALL